MAAILQGTMCPPASDGFKLCEEICTRRAFSSTADPMSGIKTRIDESWMSHFQTVEDPIAKPYLQ
jgi:hypothetical protein